MRKADACDSFHREHACHRYIRRSTPVCIGADDHRDVCTRHLERQADPSYHLVLLCPCSALPLFCFALVLLCPAPLGLSLGLGLALLCFCCASAVLLLCFCCCFYRVPFRSGGWTGEKPEGRRTWMCAVRGRGRMPLP